jgi:protein-S-isoprenylcysteine O-methyltransferase Ste14
MSHVIVMRILFGLFLLNEVVVLLRSSAEEKKQIIYPRYMPLPVLLLFAPFVYAIHVPVWIGWVMASVQSVGLLLEVSSEIQLARARSFSIVPRSPSEPQIAGFYRYLENPIYVGIVLQLVAWGALMPLALVGALLSYEGFRRMVKAERAHLATLDFRHRGVDSILWN